MLDTAAKDKKVLVVEDDPSITELLAELLTEEGYSVVCCSQGRMALSQLQKENYSLMLLDMGLPDISGNEVLVQMLKLKLARSEPAPVVIVMSANLHQLEYREQVHALVAKPFNLAHLLHVVNYWLATTTSSASSTTHPSSATNPPSYDYQQP
jgi:DNA-binding response OmpR family regulator